MADNRTMTQLLQAPTEGYEDAIVIPEINAIFELKHGLINLVQNKQFFGHDKEDPHAHIRYFNKITSTMRFPDIPSTSIKLMHFPFSLEDTFYNALNANDQDSLNSAAGGNFLDKMPRECLRIIKSKSTVHNSRNKAVVTKVSSNSSTPGISPDVAALTTEVSELKNMMKTMLINKQKAQAPAPVKAVEQSCVTYRVYQPPTSQPPVYQVQPYQAPAQQMQGVLKTNFENYVKANDVVLRNMQNQGQGLQNQMTNLTKMLSKFVNSNTASSSNSGSLPSNTVTNPKEDLKGITTRSGIAYQGPTIPTSSPRVVERRTEVTKDTVFPTNNGITEDVQPPVVPVENQNPVSEPVDAPVSAPMPNPKPSIPYPSRRNDEKRRENADEQKEKFYEIFKDMSFEISFMDALTLMPKFASTLKALIVADALLLMPSIFCSYDKKKKKSLLMNKDKLLELAKIPYTRNCSAMLLKKLPEKLGDPDKFLIPCNFPGMDVCHALADLGASINLMPLSIWKKLSLPDLTPIDELRFIDEPTQVCPPPSEDVNNEKEKQEVKNLVEQTAKRQSRITHCMKNFRVVCKESSFHSNKKPQVSSVFAITSTLPSIEPKDSLIMGDDYLSTFSTEEIVPIPRESEETSRNDSKNDLPSCDDLSSIKDPRSFEKHIDRTYGDLIYLQTVHRKHREINGSTHQIIKCEWRLFSIHRILKPSLFWSIISNFVFPPLWIRSGRSWRLFKLVTDLPLLEVLGGVLPLDDSFDADDFFYIARPMTHTHEKEAPFFFSKREFDVVIRAKKGAENLAADHLSRLENPHQDKLENKEITISLISMRGTSLSGNDITAEKNKFQKDVKHYFWMTPSFQNLCDQIIRRRCVYTQEALDILAACHNGPTGDIYRFGAPRHHLDDREHIFCNGPVYKVSLNNESLYRLSKPAYQPTDKWACLKYTNRGLKKFLKGQWAKIRASCRTTG
ncbi:hypothetical protein Tco_0205964 [Tanacetum coccineum]